MSEKEIYLVSPVRDVSYEEKKFLDHYVSDLEQRDITVHYPLRDVNQDDESGLRILAKNKEIMENSKEVRVYWTGKNDERLFDLGMAFILEKPITLINREDVKRTSHKSFENILLDLDEKYRI